MYIEFFMGALFGWVMAHFYITYKLRKIITKAAEDNGMTVEEFVGETVSDVIKVPNYFTEKLENSILLYNKDTGNFVSQGNTIEELASKVYEFDKIKFAVVNHNNKQFWFVEGKVKKNLKNI
jgi:hypothetical protein